MRFDPKYSLPLSLLTSLALAGTVIGCGDGGSSESDTSTPGDTSSPAPDVGADTTTPSDTTPDATPDTTSGDGASDSETTPPSDTTPSPDAVIDPDILQGNSIIGVASRAGNFQTFLAAVLRRNLVDDLATGEFTVFAPTDAAFDAYRAATGLSAEELLASPQLDKLLRYHVVAGRLDAAAIAAVPKRPSLIEVALYFDTSDGVRVNVIEEVVAATVSVSDTPAANGFLHALDAVLVPPGFVEAGKLEGLSGMPVSLEAANIEGLDDDDAQHTIFAPTNDSFTSLLRVRGQTSIEFLADPEMPDILRYRIVEGRYLLADLLALDGTTLPSLLRQVPAAPAEAYFSAITIFESGATVRANAHPVTSADIITRNGVIHIVGEGMSLARDLRTQMLGNSMETFLNAVESQGFGGRIVAPEGPVTVFAVSNVSFIDFTPADVVAGFHIVPGMVLPADLERAAGTGLQTVAGTTLPVSIDGDGKIRVGGTRTAVIEFPLVSASNGILYFLSGMIAP